MSNEPTTLSKAEMRTLVELCTLGDDDDMTAGVVADVIVDGKHYASIASMINRGFCTWPTNGPLSGSVKPTALGLAAYEAIKGNVDVEIT